MELANYLEINNHTGSSIQQLVTHVGFSSDDTNTLEIINEINEEEDQNKSLTGIKLIH
jgi:hypothetical protein